MIATGLIDHLVASAAATPDREICGLLFGTADRIDHAVAAANVADDPSTGFEIDPATLVAAHRAMRAAGPELIGCYHSHPRGPAEPSPRDRADALPSQYWLILGEGQARLFRVAASGAFVGCSLAST